jgi:CO/xanthine dehydrogenase Mo-binding subunit
MTKMSPPSATDGKHSGIGAPVRRREDLRLVRGAGRYTADENLPGQVMPSWCARRMRTR